MPGGEPLWLSISELVSLIQYKITMFNPLGTTTRPITGGIFGATAVPCMWLY